MKYGMNIARARLLYYEIRRRGYKIPHNKIHKERDADMRENTPAALFMEIGIERA